MSGNAALGSRRSIGGVSIRTVTRFAYSPDTRARDYVARYAPSSSRHCARSRACTCGAPTTSCRSTRCPTSSCSRALGPKLLGASVLLDVHDLMPELYASKFGLADAHPMIRLLRALERRSVAFADRAISVHRPHLDALVRHGNRRTVSASS